MGRIIAAAALAVLSMFSWATGCAKPAPEPQTEVKTVCLPEGAELTGFFIRHMGMAMEPCYILRADGSGTYMKISNLAPDDWRMLEDEDEDELPENARYLGFADTVKECELAFLKKLDDDGAVRELEALIEQTGALGWDGFTKHVSTPPGVLDAGDSYEMYIELSDGTTVTVDSYNVSPAGFGDLKYEAEKLFEAVCRP
ncbi:MAG: hypothetical protein IK136_03680 [Oscillospiraceae bacterium]|nr:hypothetical protein [Oscillospiraceae bacterium]